jgi:SanA protein
MLRDTLRRPRVRRTLFALVGVLAAGVLVVGGVNLYVVLRENGDATDDIAKVPHAQTAIVLGAFVKPDGQMSTMLRDRVHQAAALYRAGKVDSVLATGDHGQWTYDEPDTMRKALQADGVPARRIFTDHAGFNTYDSMVRARKVFRVRSAVVVTQGFHMPRALYLADEAGIHASGFTASLHGYGKQGILSDVREFASRVKAVTDVELDTHVLLGPPHPITGDGRKSWGPQHPPAGATR